MPRPALQLVPAAPAVVALDDAQRVAALVRDAHAAEGRARRERDVARRCWIQAGLILLEHKGEHGFRVRTGLTERQADTARSYARAWERAGSPGSADEPVIPDLWAELNDKEVQAEGRAKFLPGAELPSLGTMTAPDPRMVEAVVADPSAPPVPVVAVAGGRGQLIYGVDVLVGLGAIPDRSVAMVGTSWPWPCSSIDYLHPDQYGREDSIEEAIARIAPVAVSCTASSPTPGRCGSSTATRLGPTGLASSTTWPPSPSVTQRRGYSCSGAPGCTRTRSPAPARGP